ncbi:MAG: hypothetical protein L6R40_008819, partial [Gallowayella cf. fulva]
MPVQIIGINRKLNGDEGLTDTLTVEMLNPTPVAAPPPPDAPENLTVTFFDENSVYLDWDDVPSATFYKIYDEVNEPSGVAQDGSPSQSFSLRDLDDGHYRFKVTAVGTTGESSASTILDFTIPYVAPSVPTVNAGADSSVTTGTAFTRTATVTNNPTTYSWTIVGPGTVIGTAAALSWTPSTAGTFTLRCTVSNSAGSASDDLILTVTNAPVTTSFGKTADGTGSSVSSADKTSVSSFVANATGVLTAGHARVWLSAAGSANTKVVVYANSSGAPGAKLA